MTEFAVTISEIEAAQERIEPHVMRTPLLESPLLNDQLGGRLLVKAEALQCTGSFKLRGAVNCVAQLTEAERVRGVVAYSSGNHAQAVAYAAGRFGTSAVIVMPSDAPAVKVEATRAYGGEVVFYDRHTEDRAVVGGRLAEERGLVLIPPYEDARVIAGQGTLGLETINQAREMGASIDAFAVCCSGGGLTAGCALAFAARSPKTQVFAVEPEGFDDTRRSLEAGHRVKNDPEVRSICDAILVDTPGEMTFAINRKLLTGALVVDDAAALRAVATAALALKVTVEPGGAVALAATLDGLLDLRGQTVCAVLTGGNVGRDVLIRAFQGP